MVLPAGPRAQQELLRVTKGEAGATIERLGACGFVPLIGPEAWEEGDRP